MDWTEHTNNPVDRPTRRLMQTFLRARSSVFPGELLQHFVTEAAGKSVMHIGCVEHNSAFVSSDRWKHRLIANSAKRCIGIDIDSGGVQLVKSLGYEAYCIDATTTAQLDERFDLIVAGDVIEHVTRLGDLLRFALRHLAPGGVIVVSTPNPYYITHVANAWLLPPMVANFEHTCWITESNMLEISRRNGLILDKIVYPLGRKANSWFGRLASRIGQFAFGAAVFSGFAYHLKVDRSPVDPH